MTSEKQRGDLASQWFPMEFVTDAFKAIKDPEFETDCRKFLNLVNGMLGDKRRVFTYPCLSAYLDDHKLQAPSDEKLEEFWIDFNVSTESMSFYISADDDEDHRWETVFVTENEVSMYSIQAPPPPSPLRGYLLIPLSSPYATLVNRTHSHHGTTNLKIQPKTLPSEDIQTIKDPAGRSLYLTEHVATTPLTVCSLYTPTVPDTTF
ncbi:Hypothetical predicted protein [Pelobates cultripes]|nr:Hypothetical predicted protein [Pelobates cultripes]